MRSAQEIEKVLNKLPPIDESNYPGMTYEQGIEEVLLWIIGEIPNEDFSYSLSEQEKKAL